VKTLAGTLNTNEMVVLRDLRLPEFDKNRRIDEQKALVFEKKCRYDIILGSNFLTKTGIDITYSDGTMSWFGNTLKMREPWSLHNSDYLAMADTFEIQIEEEEIFGEDWLESYMTNTILDAKYDAVSIDQVVKEQSHLNAEQQKDLKELLNKYKKLFDGTLGVYPHKKFHIEIEPDAKPKHSRPYAVPHIHLETFKKELQHLVKIGVLSCQGTSTWASPTFIIPKKDGRVRWISDLRELNKVVIRKQYPLPIINDILKKRNGYEFFSKLDISIQYYTFALDEKSLDLCTIITPFGKFKYNRLPMGLKCSPDFAQEVMENIFHDVEDADVYIDDVGAFSNSWDSHMSVLDTILSRLVDNGFTVNPSKCEWAVKETDWLGYWLTPQGLKPWKKKIDAVLKMERPKNLKQLRGFVGAVNYYRDMWPSRSHTMAPLTNQTGKKTFNWTPEMENAFKAMKALLAKDAISAYPNHNLPFYIYTDASDYQLGAVIMQNGRPVAYYSRKLNKAQRNYTTMEKEPLSIVETLKEFRSMLLGADLHVHTDHKNLTFANLQTQRVLRWRVYLEEYSPKFYYIEGIKNVIADTFSRLGRSEESTASVGKNSIPIDIYRDTNKLSTVNTNTKDTFYSMLEDPELVECFANLPEEDCFLNLPNVVEDEHPLDMELIKEKQYADETLIKRKDKYPKQYITKQIGTVRDIICHVKEGENPNEQW
jgi:hypothetical protein